MTLSEPAGGTARSIGVWLPGFADTQARPYGARSDESVVVGDLLMRHVPALARGDLEIVAIARRPGVLTKVAVRRRARVKLSARPVSLVVGVGADYVNRVKHELGGERIEVLQWVGDPASYIASALGLGYLPPVDLQAAARLANVLLGDIDVRGVRGKRGVNLLLASALTGWRIRLREISRSAAWKSLERAMTSHRTVPSTVQARVPKGLAVTMSGLNALLPTGQVRGIRKQTPADEVDALLRAHLGQEIHVHVLRLDTDTGLIVVSEQIPAARQLRLFED
jgi:transcription antitermination factor NusA-like protein